MKETRFYKWQGTGNDFIILDNRDNSLDDLDEKTIKSLCNRRFGIGADGLMTLNHNPIYDFSMNYFNADGIEAEMCGNGGRCMIGFANQLGIIREETRFAARDGLHRGKVLGNDRYLLQMIDLKAFRKATDYYFLNTGVPHVVKFVEDVDSFDVYNEGKKLRYSDEFSPSGTNVNFVEFSDVGIKIRTYERGVEDETLSCGTGAVASAIAAYLEKDLNNKKISCRVPGGQLFVRFDRKDTGEFSNIYLEGPAVQVFEGTVLI
jgi:diaminopimelate epimerase